MEEYGIRFPIQHLPLHPTANKRAWIAVVNEDERKEIGQSPEKSHKAFDNRRHVYGTDDQHTHAALQEPSGPVDGNQQEQHIHHNLDDL
jgi:hypothetical protein